MKLQIETDAEGVAQRAAAWIAAAARAAVAARGQFVLAVSGGRTPWRMLTLLAGQDVPWPKVHVVQVDERVAPLGEPDRNMTHIGETLLTLTPLPPDQLYDMPVTGANLEAAAGRYAKELQAVAGSPPVLDVVHLGLGADGHTASLVPGDPVLDVTEADVAASGPYQSHRRMTLTYPIINRARQILFVVSGAEKAAALARLVQGDTTIPAGRVNLQQATIIADQPAAAQLPSS